nr:MAG TPA: hypothetical protein [Caudoviricetes sp.]
MPYFHPISFKNVHKIIIFLLIIRQKCDIIFKRS